jgi:hypothetical protein
VEAHCAFNHFGKAEISPKTSKILYISFLLAIPCCKKTENARIFPTPDVKELRNAAHAGGVSLS